MVFMTVADLVFFAIGAQGGSELQRRYGIVDALRTPSQLVGDHVP